MKRMKWIVIIVAALVLASFTLADAQRWGGKGRWGVVGELLSLELEPGDR